MLGWTLLPSIGHCLFPSRSTGRAVRSAGPIFLGRSRRRIIRPFVVTPTREVSLVIVIVRCHAAILKHAAEIPAHRSLWYSSKLTISECRRLSLMAESMARAAGITG